MASLTTLTPVTPDGILVSGALGNAGAASNTFANNGAVLIAIRNGSLSSTTATFVSSKTVDDGGAAALAVADRAVAIAAGETRLIGPFPTDIFNDATTGEVTMTLSAHADVTVAVIGVSVRDN